MIGKTLMLLGLLRSYNKAAKQVAASAPEVWAEIQEIGPEAKSLLEYHMKALSDAKFTGQERNIGEVKTKAVLDRILGAYRKLPTW